MPIPIKNPKIDFSILNQVSIYENEGKDAICNEVITNAELHKYIDDIINLKFKDIYLYNNPNEEYKTKEWGYSKNSSFLDEGTDYFNNTMKQILWVSPKLGSKLPAIAIKNTIKRQNRLTKLLNFQKIEFEVVEMGPTGTITYKDGKKRYRNEALGVITPSCRVLLNRRKYTGEWLYFFPNTEAEVEIVFDVIEKLGFFEGWEKNPDYKKSSQDNSTISYETDENIIEDIQSENLVDTRIVDENTVKIETVEETETPLENFDFVASEEDDKYETSNPEGKEKIVIQTVYERNPENRKICINHYKQEDDDKKIKCQICGFDFEAFFGELGKDFIEVHHRTPLSQIKSETKIRPIIDLIPVCSNCHRMLHRSKDECLSVDELRNKIRK